ncbi:MAG: NAD(P)-dependent oxidoreductase [Pseudomonadota bacterium]
MTTVLVSGATGLVGQFIVEYLLRSGRHVVCMGRRAPPVDFFSKPVGRVSGNLEPTNDWAGTFHDVDQFVHCAFHHVPGKYRGGEGDDPHEFRRLNVDGSLALFAAAKNAGVKRAVFLSSRAVYDGVPPGARLTEDMPVAPTSLYGQVKHDVEVGLASLINDNFEAASVRATGIYGPPRPGQRHKWNDLFDAFERGEAISPRVATEVHGEDLAAAIALLLSVDSSKLHAFGKAPVFNTSDIVLDRRALLQAYGERSAIRSPLPPIGDQSSLGQMDCTRLKGLGWQPRGKLDLAGF